MITNQFFIRPPNTTTEATLDIQLETQHTPPTRCELVHEGAIALLSLKFWNDKLLQEWLDTVFFNPQGHDHLFVHPFPGLNITLHRFTWLHGNIKHHKLQSGRNFAHESHLARASMLKAPGRTPDTGPSVACHRKPQSQQIVARCVARCVLLASLYACFS